MSLLELTVCIAVLLSLITIAFVGSRSWKRGSDRAACVMALRNVQVAARSYQNLYGYNYGGSPYAENGSRDIARHLFEKGYIEKPLYDLANGAGNCPGGGSYIRLTPDTFPEAGVLYMSCSLAAPENHRPASMADW
jgi:type II secretory pathway pseudopilin PulG